jgi:hypothetical protein
MMVNTCKKALVVLAVCIAAQLYADAALAAHPTSVVGTWRVRINQEVDTLVIESQGGSINGVCRRIVGYFPLQNQDDGPQIHGFYCPKTGRIQFVHSNLDSNLAVRVFTGNLLDRVEGQPDRMGGTFTVLYTAVPPPFGPLGEYGFWATKVE